MITFSGKIESDIQAKVITKRSQFLGIIGIILGVVGLMSSFIVWLVVGRLDAEVIKILILSGICVLIYGLICIPTSRRSRSLRFVWDYTINFEDETITAVFNHQQGAVQSYKISKVKKIVDYGRYYYVFLYRLDPSKGIVCQKDLLTEGTIEEFEELFKDKIIRKGK